MISTIEYLGLSAKERSQLERKDLARGAWAEGRPEDALLILESILDEQMTPRVAAEVYVSQAAFLAEQKEFGESARSLEKAARFIDSAPDRVRASFHHQRARIHKEAGRLDDALTDYAGSAACCEPDKERQGVSFLNQAGVYLALGDASQAHEYVDRATEIFLETESPNISQAYDTQAKIYLLEGKIEQAVEANRKSLEVNTNEPWTPDFLRLATEIQETLRTLLETVKVGAVEYALKHTNGNLKQAGDLIGMTHKGVDYVITQHGLDGLRAERKTRRKSIIKKI